ncbi:hypothetical protein MMC09_000823 [Bachmanniomyces sp. S44760]|nr:hypothetical protein [Bachmanniomyces sp. S44760]
MEVAVKRFFSSPYFAVAGASQDTNKFGYKGRLTEPEYHALVTVSDEIRVTVLAWYHVHSLSVTPLNPTTSEIRLPPSSTTHAYQTVPSPSSLPNPAATSLSVITPPKVTLKILKEAKEAGVPAVWLQPGSFDSEGLEYAQKEFEAGIGGDGGDGGEGWCVLVDGENGLKAAGKDIRKGRL